MQYAHYQCLFLDLDKQETKMEVVEDEPEKDIPPATAITIPIEDKDHIPENIGKIFYG